MQCQFSILGLSLSRFGISSTWKCFKLKPSASFIIDLCVDRQEIYLFFALCTTVHPSWLFTGHLSGWPCTSLAVCHL